MLRKISNTLLVLLTFFSFQQVTLSQEDEKKSAEVTAATTSTESASEVTTSKAPRPYRVIWHTGRGLPSKIHRMNIGYINASGSDGFTKDRQSENTGVNIDVNAMSIKYEYGVNKHFSIGAGLPIITSNTGTIDAAQFRNSSKYKENFNKFANKIAAGLVGTPFCATLAACLAALNGPLPVAIPVTLPTGETTTLAAGTPIATQLDTLLINQATPQDGFTGLGDLEVGGIYNFFVTGPFRTTLGMGMSLPTGKFKNVPAGSRATGVGNYLAKARVNFDYSPLAGLWFGVQHQVERSVGKAKVNVDSMLDNSQTLATTFNYERGFLQTGFVQAAFAFGVLADPLTPFGLILEYQYKRKDADKINNKRDHEFFGAMWETKAKATLRAILPKALKLPMMAEVSYTMPLDGKNVLISTNSLNATLRAYYKF